ncbi:MAG: 16S rRNA (cytosine(1402)-N(4))-methyltransferase RsmH, partial [Acidobacteriota bacterium]
MMPSTPPPAGGESSAASRHVPVLLAEVQALLAPVAGCIVDCTLGLGGHAAALLAAHPSRTLIGLDRDPDALALARERLAPFADRITLVHGGFADLGRHLEACGRTTVDGLIADLGVSSMQLDEAHRGFAFRLDGPLDMRMDGASTDASPTAADWIDAWSEDELARWIRIAGDEPHARRIARAIVAAHAEAPIATTARLAAVVEQAVPQRPRRSRAGRRRPVHPATRTFQALRIAVNGELDQLDALLAQLPQRLAPNGRAAMLSYHSLEDRRVKHAFRDGVRGVPDPITGAPTPGSQIYASLTRRALRPGDDEIIRNPRARSARLR